MNRDDEDSGACHREECMNITFEIGLVEAAITKGFVQDNETSSTKGVLRELHFQKNQEMEEIIFREYRIYMCQKKLGQPAWRLNHHRETLYH